VGGGAGAGRGGGGGGEAEQAWTQLWVCWGTGGGGGGVAVFCPGLPISKGKTAETHTQFRKGI